MKSIVDNDKRVYDQAIRFLARRPHGERELATKLARAGAGPGAIEKACDRCRELGYLDDAAFAASRARLRLLSGHYGPQRVRSELSTLGVAGVHIESALECLLRDNDEAALARAALEKRFGPVGGAGEAATHQANRRATVKEFAKQYNHLARRGFGHETIRQVMGSIDYEG